MFFRSIESRIEKLKAKRDINKLIMYFFKDEEASVFAKKALYDLLKEDTYKAYFEHIYEPFVCNLIRSNHSDQKILEAVQLLRRIWRLYDYDSDHVRKKIFVDFIIKELLLRSDNKVFIFDNIIEMLFQVENYKSRYVFGSYHNYLGFYNLASYLRCKSSESILCCGLLSEDQEISNICFASLASWGGITAVIDLGGIIGSATVDMTSYGGYSDQEDIQKNQKLYGLLMKLYTKLSPSEKETAIVDFTKRLDRINEMIRTDSYIGSYNIVRVKMLYRVLRAKGYNEIVENNILKMKEMNHKDLKELAGY